MAAPRNILDLVIILVGNKRFCSYEHFINTSTVTLCLCLAAVNMKKWHLTRLGRAVAFRVCSYETFVSVMLIACHRLRSEHPDCECFCDLQIGERTYACGQSYVLPEWKL